MEPTVFLAEGEAQQTPDSTSKTKCFAQGVERGEPGCADKARGCFEDERRTIVEYPFGGSPESATCQEQRERC